jgi:hypothetical protein
MFHATGLTGWQRAAMNAPPTQAAAAAATTELKKQSLETEIEAMQSQLDAMKKRLAEVETQQT